jgi:hypothetical protein
VVALAAQVLVELLKKTELLDNQEQQIQAAEAAVDIIKTV